METLAFVVKDVTLSDIGNIRYVIKCNSDISYITSKYLYTTFSQVLTYNPYFRLMIPCFDLKLFNIREPFLKQVLKSGPIVKVSPSSNFRVTDIMNCVIYTGYLQSKKSVSRWLMVKLT